MTWFDHAVLLIVGVSALIAVIRGFVREVLALAAWLVAFLVASAFAAQLAPLLPEAIPSEELRMLAAFVLVFGTTLLVMSLLTLVLVELIRIVGLGFLDRFFGLLFGLVRGVAIVLTAVLLGGLTALPAHPAWRDAMLSSPLEALALTVKPLLPAELGRHIRFDPVQQVVYTSRR